MIEGLGTLLWSQAIVVLFGMSVALLPSLRKCSLSSRIAIGWLAGATSIAMLAPLLSIAGAWGERSIAIPLIAAAIIAPVAARRRAHAARLVPEPPAGGWSMTAIAFMVLAVALTAHGVVSGRSVTSSTFLRETAKAERWAEDGVEPALFLMSGPTAPPLPSMPPMWTAMLQRDAALVSGPWMQMVLLAVFVALARTPLRRLLDPAAAALSVGSLALVIATAGLAAQAGGASSGWVIVLAPLALLLTAAPGTPIMFLAAVAAACSGAHEAGILFGLALAGFEITRGHRRRATWIASASIAAVAPWWLLLATRGLFPWSRTGVPAVPAWQILDAGLIVVTLVSLLLIAARWRRGMELVPLLAFVAIMIVIALTHGTGVSEGVLLFLRWSAPLLVSGAAILSLRPLRRQMVGFHAWTPPS